MTIQHGVFSVRQQDLLKRMDGIPSRVPAGYGVDQGYVMKPSRSFAAQVYEGADPEEILVVTTLADPSRMPNFPDLLDLGPVGRPLHSFPASGPHPTQAMILPRHRLADLVADRLGVVEAMEANEAAVQRAAVQRAAGSPSPAP